jgi:dolichyl-diphosphooligosaccharide--protein glycosyltransferase/undecaprenyl-diphosphooligosaccharide--protein glycosyltransferase
LVFKKRKNISGAMELKIMEKLIVKNSSLSIRSFLVMMVVVYIFSIAMRMIWVYQFQDVEQYQWNNQIMINTNDGYWYAEGARDILKGSHEMYDLSPIDSPLSKLTAFLSKYIPVSFETLILYMPTFFGSLLVFPIMLIARTINQDKVGLLAALLGGIAWSYYNRTMTGYYDTDLLVVVLPTFFTWATIWSLHSKKLEFFWFAPLIASASFFWHGGILHIANGILIMGFIYTLMFERKNLFYYKFLSLFIIALASLPFVVKIIIIFLLNFVYITYKDKLKESVVISIVVASVLIYFFFGGWSWLIGIINSGYVSRFLVADEINVSLKFFGVVNTVREAGHIPFETFANRISGHTVTFVLSVVGYILFLIRYRLMLLSLPMVVLGFFALQGGLRFTVFSVPFMALGVSFLIFVIANFLQNNIAKYLFVALCTVGVLYPNIQHIIDYKVPVVFQKNEVEVLDKLGRITSREDYVVSWWDYGYPIRYYSDVKTLIDGAKHDGADNFPTSFALSEPQMAAANMMRLDVEFTELGYKNKCFPTFKCMLKAYNEPNPNKFLPALSNPNLQLPPKTRDIYLYLPHRMLNIFPTVVMFENLDLVSGQRYNNPFFLYSSTFQDLPDRINLQQGVSIMKQGGMIHIGGQQIQLNAFITAFYDANGKLQRQVQQINDKSPISVIFMKSYNAFLVVDQKMLNSTFIQLFVLENYDPNLFDPVIMTPLAKVFKLKK